MYLKRGNPTTTKIILDFANISLNLTMTVSESLRKAPVTKIKLKNKNHVLSKLLNKRITLHLLDDSVFFCNLICQHLV